MTTAPVVTARRSPNLGRILVFGLLGVAFYVVYMIASDLGKVGAELVRFRWLAFALACALAFGNYVLRFAKWEFYLSRLGVRGVGKWDSFLIFLSGFVFTVSPGKVGEVFKSLVLSETYGVEMARTAPIVIAERVTDLIGIIILICLGSLGFHGGLVVAAIGAGLVGALLAVIATRPLMASLIRLVTRLPGRLRNLGPKLAVAHQSLSVLVSPTNLLLPAALSTVAWALECLSLWVILWGFGERVPVALATFFYSTSTLMGAIIPVPGGLGVTESALQTQMSGVGHLTTAVSTVAMILVRLATLWFAVLIGFVALGLLRRRYPTLLKGA